MKIEKADESLSNIFEGFIRYEQTLINSLSGENWDIADSMALTECDCLIILDVDTNAFAVSADKPEGLNPLHAPLEFGLQDTFDAFEKLIGCCYMAKSNKITYFRYMNLIMLYVGEPSQIAERFNKYKAQTALYFADETYAKLTNL